MGEERQNVIIHVGRHKAASTFLQQAFFPQLTRQLCHDNRGLFQRLGQADFQPQEFRRFISDHYRQYKKTPCINPEEGAPLILSREGLSFSPQGHAVELYARNLKAAWPEARIICIIREQFDMLVTLYVWHTNKRFLTGSLTRYLETLMESSEAGHVLHDEAIRTYMDEFGRDKVLVLPHELLKADARTFLGRIAEFIDPRLRFEMPGRARNVSYKKRAVLRGVKVFNAFIKTVFLAPGGTVAKIAPAPVASVYKAARFRLLKFNRHHLSAALDRAFPNGRDVELEPAHYRVYAERIAKSNAETEKLTGLDLAAYGYATPRNLESFLETRR